MALYRNISISFWTDDKVDDEMTPEDKYFYLYLLTNPHTNICGCYSISNKQLERETGYNMDTIMRLLERFEKIHDVIRYNRETKEVLILKWGKYNWSSSEKVEKSVENVAQHIKCSDFRDYVLRAVTDRDYQYQTTDYRLQSTVTDNSNRIQKTDTVSDTDVSIGYPYPIHTVSKSTSKEEVDDFFEYIWSLYPLKRGKGRVSDAKKRKLYKIGEEQMVRCIERYRAEANPKYLMQGSTFFNSGYVDFLDENYQGEVRREGNEPTSDIWG